MRMQVVSDDEFGAVAAVIDEDGRIIATASDGIRDGVYMAFDEGTLYALTGELLPAPLWDRAKS